MGHHNKHLMAYFKFLHGSRIICLPLNILEKLHWQHLSEKLQETESHHLLIRYNTLAVVITTAQLHSAKPEFRFCADLNLAGGVLEFRNGEDLWQYTRLEITLNAFRWLMIPQKQFIIAITPWRTTSTIQTNGDHHLLFFIRIPILYLDTFWSILLTKPTIIFKIFWDFFQLYQIFLLPQVIRCVIITYKHGIYELPHNLLNDFRLRILGY